LLHYVVKCLCDYFGQRKVMYYFGKVLFLSSLVCLLISCRTEWCQRRPGVVG